MVEVLTVFAAQTIVIGEGGSKFLEYPSDNLPICGAKVSAKGLSTGEEEYVGDDVGKSPNDVWVQFYLPESRFDVIGVCHNVGGREVGPEQIYAGQDSFFDVSKETGGLRALRG
jgi:hypothetical protein